MKVLQSVQTLIAGLSNSEVGVNTVVNICAPFLYTLSLLWLRSSFKYEFNLLKQGFELFKEATNARLKRIEERGK